MKSKTRVFNITVPRSICADVTFRFMLSYRFDEIAQHVVVDWRETTIGSGSLVIPDVGITWSTLFVSWRTCQAIAERAALKRRSSGRCK